MQGTNLRADHVFAHSPKNFLAQHVAYQVCRIVHHRAEHKYNTRVQNGDGVADSYPEVPHDRLEGVASPRVTSDGHPDPFVNQAVPPGCAHSSSGLRHVRPNRPDECRIRYQRLQASRIAEPFHDTLRLNDHLVHREPETPVTAKKTAALYERGPDTLGDQYIERAAFVIILSERFSHQSGGFHVLLRVDGQSQFLGKQPHYGHVFPARSISHGEYRFQSIVQHAGNRDSHARDGAHVLANRFRAAPYAARNRRDGLARRLARGFGQGSSDEHLELRGRNDDIDGFRSNIHSRDRIGIGVNIEEHQRPAARHRRGADLHQNSLGYQLINNARNARLALSRYSGQLGAGNRA